nr:HPF/RaiA family ribosome-associated protein [uncultured Holophaga sp.]
MQIVMKAMGFKLTSALRDFIRERLAGALARRADQIRSVVVRLTDLNGPKGGVDKRCTIQVDLIGQRLQFAEATHPDTYAAIIEASRKANRGLNRQLARASH